MKRQHIKRSESSNYLQLTLCIKREPLDGGSQSTFYANMVGNFTLTQKTHTLINTKNLSTISKKKEKVAFLIRASLSTP